MRDQRESRALTSRRTDARRNRQAILRVADEAFSQGSDVVPLAEIARRAGLGRATVYRHFSDRKTLGAAVVSQQLGMWRRAIGESDGECCSFRDLLHGVLSDQVSRRPLVNLFRALPARDQRQHADALIAVLTPGFRRAQASGELRSDVEPADLVPVFEMIEVAVAAGSAGAGRDATTRRLIAVLLDGLFIAPFPGSHR
ncbi:TetR family transcriptional regulator [Parasphingorhabdus pacifica]